MSASSVDIRKDVEARRSAGLVTLEDIAVGPARLSDSATDVSIDSVSLTTLRPGAESMTFADECDFRERGLEKISIPCRIYGSESWPPVVIVPEEYAAQLDAVRELRQQLETSPNPDASGILGRFEEMLEPSSLLGAFIRRLDTLDAETTPIGRARLVETANGATDSKTAHDAAVLLAFVGTSSDMACLTRTDTLDVSRIPVEADVLDRIGSIPTLRHLHVAHTGANGDWLAGLSSLPLETLNVAGLKLFNYHLYPIHRIKTLRSLDISETLINDGALDILSNMDLRVLTTERSVMTDAGRQTLRERRPGTRVD